MYSGTLLAWLGPYTSGCSDLLVVDILGLIRYGATAMRSLATSVEEQLVLIIIVIVLKSQASYY